MIVIYLGKSNLFVTTPLIKVASILKQYLMANNISVGNEAHAVLPVLCRLCADEYSCIESMNAIDISCLQDVFLLHISLLFLPSLSRFFLNFGGSVIASRLCQSTILSLIFNIEVISWFCTNLNLLQ